MLAVSNWGKARPFFGWEWLQGVGINLPFLSVLLVTLFTAACQLLTPSAPSPAAKALPSQEEGQEALFLHPQEASNEALQMLLMGAKQPPLDSIHSCLK